MNSENQITPKVTETRKSLITLSTNQVKSSSNDVGFREGDVAKGEKGSLHSESSHEEEKSGKGERKNSSDGSDIKESHHETFAKSEITFPREGNNTNKGQEKEEELNIEEELMKSEKCIDCSPTNILLSVGFLCVVITCISLFFVYNSEIKDFADDYTTFLEDRPFVATLSFMTVYILTRPFCIPATVFILFGAYIYGEAFGFMAGFFIFVFIDYICLLIGTHLSFLNGRYLFKNCVQNCIEKKPKLTALSMALSHNAKKLVFLLRLCSLTPYYIFNYVCSITNMTHKDYFIGNLAIILCDGPYIYVAASLSDISKVEDSSSNMGFWYYVIIGLSIAIVIVVIILVYYFSKKELTKTLREIEQQRKDEKDKTTRKEKSEESDRESEVKVSQVSRLETPSQRLENQSDNLASNDRMERSSRISGKSGSIVPITPDSEESV